MNTPTTIINCLCTLAFILAGVHVVRLIIQARHSRYLDGMKIYCNTKPPIPDVRQKN